MKLPDLSFERAAWTDGYRLVAGIDEAGRGAWAGPVAAAAVLLPSPMGADLLRQLDGVRDSKMLSPGRREALYFLIRRVALAMGVGMAGPEEIMQRGIATATRLAMAQAVEQLAPRPDFLLIDWVRLPQVDLPQKSIRKGDQVSLSVAAASIVAKVTRDRLMVELAQAYPGYGFEQHKGYGTQMHQAAIAQHGIAPVHRHTWKPFVQMLADC